jgi:hypothetical protein
MVFGYRDAAELALDRIGRSRPAERLSRVAAELRAASQPPSDLADGRGFGYRDDWGHA